MFEAETPAERMRRRRESIEFYQHGVNWTNRMIAGDSLVVMNSLPEKEGMAGQVQMVYMVDARKQVAGVGRVPIGIES